MPQTKSRPVSPQLLVSLRCCSQGSPLDARAGTENPPWRPFCRRLGDHTPRHLNCNGGTGSKAPGRGSPRSGTRGPEAAPAAAAAPRPRPRSGRAGAQASAPGAPRPRRPQASRPRPPAAPRRAAAPRPPARPLSPGPAVHGYMSRGRPPPAPAAPRPRRPPRERSARQRRPGWCRLRRRPAPTFCDSGRRPRPHPRPRRPRSSCTFRDPGSAGGAAAGRLTWAGGGGGGREACPVPAGSFATRVLSARPTGRLPCRDQSPLRDVWAAAPGKHSN